MAHLPAVCVGLQMLLKYAILRSHGNNYTNTPEWYIIHTVTNRVFGLTKTMFIDTTDRIIKSVVNAEHFTIILRITLIK